MRIVLLSVWYSEKMGYAENVLPKALSALGHDVHVITSTAQVYYNDPDYDTIYKPYLGDKYQNKCVKTIDGFTLHRLAFLSISSKLILKGIRRKLKEIDPDIVQSFDPFSFLTFQGVLHKYFMGYKYFTANHTHASVFPLLRSDKVNVINRLLFFMTRTIPGRMVSWSTSRSYPTAVDCMEIAIKYYGIPERKNKLAPLGVDTDVFKPMENEDHRNKKRNSLGILNDEIVCIYTGRFTEEKNPLCLAMAINELAGKGEKFKALFMGEGPQAGAIKKMRGCIIRDFVPYQELPIYYQIADIGVWPRQESTSMLDGIACGLPLIISNKVQAIERVEGNGLTYVENDYTSLADRLLQLKDLRLREEYSRNGVEKIRIKYSWLKIASDRVEDYRSFLKE